MITQIENYQKFGANFDAAQGAVFQGRFDNELNNGTLEADSSTAIKALMGILNGDTGNALAADNAALAAAGNGFVADAMDVSGNNIAIGGATYVGTATTVSTATSVLGLAQGTTQVTANPNIANGTGGTTSSGTTISTGGTTTAGGGTTTTTGGTTTTTGSATTGTGTGSTTTTSNHPHHDNGTAAAAATGSTHSTATTHSTEAAHSTSMLDHHAMHYLWM